MTDEDPTEGQPRNDVGNRDRTGSAPDAMGSEPPIRQLDSIIENLATFATPVLREIAARAAELAAKAGEAAGPMAQRAADKADAVGDRIATESRGVASDLRRETSVGKTGSSTAPLEPADQTRAEEEAGLPPR